MIDNEADLTQLQISELTSARNMSVASMILGICGLIVFTPCAIAALLLGRSAKRTLSRYPNEAERCGAGMARAGVVMGWIGVSILIFIAAAIVALLALIFAFSG